jgi:hypothetical protein
MISLIRKDLKGRNLVQFAKDYGVSKSQIWRLANNAFGSERRGVTLLLEQLETKGYFEEIGLIKEPEWESELRMYLTSIPEVISRNNPFIAKVKSIVGVK